MCKNKRLISLVLIFSLFAAAFSFAGNFCCTAEAEENWVEVTTMEGLKKELETYDTKAVRVTKDISFESHLTDEYYITVHGKKKLDLNGHSVYFDDISNLTGIGPYYVLFSAATHTFMLVASGAELNICDSGSGGRIRTSGYFIAMTNKNAGHYCDMYNEICTRNGIEVRGKLTVTGGQIEAGDKKKQFLGLPVYIDGEQKLAGHEAYHVIYGSAVIVKEKGKFLALGGRYDGYGPGKAAVTVEKGGYARFYDGLVCGQCSADCFSVDENADVIVYGGTCETYYEEYLRE